MRAKLWFLGLGLIASLLVGAYPYQLSLWEPPPTVIVSSHAGVYSENPEFHSRIISSLWILYLMPGMSDWWRIVDSYQVEFRENEACPGVMCAYYHKIGTRVYSTVGVRPSATFSPNFGAAMMIHELMHIADMSRGCWDPPSLEYRASITSWHEAKKLNLTPGEQEWLDYLLVKSPGPDKC